MSVQIRIKTDIRGHTMAYDTMYDKSGNLISNEELPEIPAYFGKNTYLGVNLGYLPQIGYYLQYQDKEYEIMTVTTYQEKPGDVVIVTHVLKCLEVDEDGEDVGNEPIILKMSDNSDSYGIVGI